MTNTERQYNANCLKALLSLLMAFAHVGGAAMLNAEGDATGAMVQSAGVAFWLCVTLFRTIRL